MLLEPESNVSSSDLPQFQPAYSHQVEVQELDKSWYVNYKYTIRFASVPTQIGKVSFKIRKVFILSMALSMCILNEDMVFPRRTSSGVLSWCPSINGKVFSSIPILASSCLIVKPWSSMIATVYHTKKSKVAGQFYI